MKKKWIYISLGLIAATAVVLLVSKRDKDSGSNDSGEGSEGDNEGQKTQPLLSEMIKNKTIIGKDIKSQVDNVRLRFSSYVNDGFANNKYGEVATKNTVIGKVKQIAKDHTGATNPVTKTTYNWLGVEITDAVYDDIQANQRNFLTRDVWKNKRIPLWVREDVVTL